MIAGGVVIVATAGVAVHVLGRSPGMPDGYPLSLPAVVVDNRRVVHEVVSGWAPQISGYARQRTESRARFA